MQNPERPFRVLALIIAALLFAGLAVLENTTRKQHHRQEAAAVSTTTTVKETTTTTAPPATSTTEPPTTTTTTEPPWQSRGCPEGWQNLHRSVCYARMKGYESKIHVVRVDWTDPRAEVNVANTTPNGVGRRPLSAAAQKRGSLVAINAAFFDCKCHSARNIGPLVEEGQFVSTDSRSQWTMTVYDGFNSEVVHSTEVMQRGSEGVKLAVSGSHPLVMGSKPATVWDGSCHVQCRHPRTAFGVNHTGFGFLVVVDGRTHDSAGMTLPELAQLMSHLGTATAVSLDGGGSSEMVINGQIVNRLPSGRERPVTSLVEVAVK